MTLAALALALLLPAAALGAVDFTVPLGPHETVGVTRLTFTKPSETTGEPRRLDTSIWYPAKAGTGTPDGAAFRDATPLRRPLPLIMFSHGSCAFPGQSPFLTVGLASWGFVVAAPPHPGNTIGDFPNCFDLTDTLANRVADIRFVLDTLLASDSPFAGAINRRRIGMTGHSLGGHTTLRVAAADSRVRGAVALAPAAFGLEDLRIETPLMVLGAELDSLTPFDTASRNAYALLTGPRYLVEMLNTGHCAFAVAASPDRAARAASPARSRRTRRTV